jgi:hypothetical protein
MSYKILFILNALVAVVVGLGFLFKPDFALPVLGVTEQYAATVWASRFFGSAMLALGLVLWFAKDSDERVQKGMSWGMLASALVGLVLTLLASFSGNAVLRQNTWILIVLYVLFGLGYAFVLFFKPKVQA